jgi:Glycosyl transferase family 2
VADVTRRRAQATLTEAPEVRELRARLGQQAEVIEELRCEVDWLIEELLRKDANGTGPVSSDPFGDDGLPPDWRPMLHAMRRLVYQRLPQGSRIAVVSSGVEPLLRFAGYHAEHFSQDRFGEYTGRHPSCGLVAVVQLAAACWRGIEFLLIPQSELWWLEHYPELANHLERCHARVAEDDEGGVIWDLRMPGPQRAVHDLLASLSCRLDHRPAMLDWHTGHDLAASFDAYKVFTPLGSEPVLPYLDGTVDVVALGDETLERASEAIRIASALVLHIASDTNASIDVLWQTNEIEERTDAISIAVASADGRAATPNFVNRLLDTLPVSFAGEVVLDAACGDVSRPARSGSRRGPRTKVVRCRRDDDFRARLRRCAAAASGDVLVVLDASIWPAPGWLLPLVRPLRNRDVAFVTGRWVEQDGHLIGPRGFDGYDTDAMVGDLDAARHTRVRRLGETSTGFFATRRRLFLEWDEASSGGTDVSRAYSAYVSADRGALLYEPESIAISAAGPPAPSEEQRDA